MARKPSTLKDVKVKKAKPDVNIICTSCGIEKKSSDFYIAYNSKLSVAPFCKECVVTNSLTEDGVSVNMDGFHNMLQRLDRPFLNQLWISNVKKYGTDPRKLIGLYFKDISMQQYRALSWEHSDFGYVEEKVEPKVEEAPKKQTNKKQPKMTSATRNTLVDKWGDFSDDELTRFERKYQMMSKGYQILTVMHEEALCNYCKLQVMYEIAIEQKNTQEAKLYGDLAKQARADAKLNPNQLKKEDFTAGGANSFGEIARLVSKRDGVLKLPMEYIKQPNDRLDIMIWDLINYNRALKGMPECEYEEIYQFYIDRINRHNERYNADIENGNLGNMKK